MLEVALKGRGENDRGITATGAPPAEKEGDRVWNNRSGNDNGNAFELAVLVEDIEDTEEEVVEVDENEEMEEEEREEGMRCGVEGVDHVGDGDGEGEKQSGDVDDVLLVLLMGYPIPWRTVATLRGIVTDIAWIGGVAPRPFQGNPGRVSFKSESCAVAGDGEVGKGQ